MKNKVSIVIVSYNNMYLLQKCIESIKTTNAPDTFEIIVVDNASTDGVREWLCEQEDIKTILLDLNVGFPMGCNIGASYAEPGYDIFLLNNDTRLCEHSLEWLECVLNSDFKVGAVGAVSNYAGNNQQIDVEFSLPMEYIEYGNRINNVKEAFCEERVRLSGFAMLIRRTLWDSLGGFDEDFSPGYFEDDDLSMRITNAGYKLYVCHNAFIYHAGSQSFSGRNDINELLIANHARFSQKYGFDILEEYSPDPSVLISLPTDRNAEFNILIVGAGLGSEICLVESMYPRANIVGIEDRNELYLLAGRVHAMANSIEELAASVKNPIFQFVYISDRGKFLLTNTDTLSLLCMPGCKIYSSMKNEIDFTRVKLVIWDLDNTFWAGTLSEQNVSLIYENISILKNLTDAGVVNSISSKNEEEDTKVILDELGISDYFVFNNINWDNKGMQIRDKLSRMHLRPENVLYIDDEPHNLEEARFMNEGLLVSAPSIIPFLYMFSISARKSDINHERLAHYHILQAKEKVSSKFENPKDFLKYSKINVAITELKPEEFERVFELINRTNQLNYTKIRRSTEEFNLLCLDKNIKKWVVRATDRFGDYGIVGFAAISNNRLLHFLFSCRVVGMGISQYVFNELRNPELSIIEPVAERLDCYKGIDWINQSDAASVSDLTNKEKENKGRKVKILMKGPCDMSAIEPYLIGGEITTEFNHVNESGFISASHNHSMHIWESENLDAREIASIIEEVPFIAKDDFETSLFSEEYDVICYSLLQDCHAGLYKNKTSGAYVAFGSRNFDITNSKNIRGYIDGSMPNHGFSFDKEIIQEFSERWKFVEKTPIELLLRNIDYIYENIKGNPVLVLILGSEMKYEGTNPEFENFEKWHKEVNEAIRAYSEGRDNIKLVDVNDFIHSQKDYGDSINHYARNVYYDIATEVVSIINDKVDEIKRQDKK